MKKAYRRTLTLLLIFLLSLSLAACADDGAKRTTAPETTLAATTPTEATAPSTSAPLPEAYMRADGESNLVCIAVEGYGNIVLELYPEIAPITVANFKRLISEGFYTGSSFHRVIDGFMIQGGRSASGKRADTIYGEFTSNGHRNDLKHTRGVISMARTSIPDSATSEFFIVQTAHADWLDGDYAAFGRVLSGMDTVDLIASVPTYSNDSPKKAVTVLEIFFVTAR